MDKMKTDSDAENIFMVARLGVGRDWERPGEKGDGIKKCK